MYWIGVFPILMSEIILLIILILLNVQYLESSRGPRGYFTLLSYVTYIDWPDLREN